MPETTNPDLEAMIRQALVEVKAWNARLKAMSDADLKEMSQGEKERVLAQVEPLAERLDALLGQTRA